MRRHDDLCGRCGSFSRPLCLYSGGLDGTVLLHRLVSEGLKDIVALTVDLGGKPSISVVREVCDHLDIRSVVVDRRAEFAEEYVLATLAAHGTYLGSYPISASLSRPLMARVALQVAEAEGCDAILHTATRSQNSLRRFNGALSDLRFGGPYGSPLVGEPINRSEKRQTLQRAGITGFESRTCSIDVNLWCREFEGEGLDDPEDIKYDAEFRWSRLTNSSPEEVTILFEKGRPTEVNGDSLGLVELVERLNVVVGGFGLGRFVGFDELVTGHKVQEIREAPAACLLLDAYRRLEHATISSEVLRVKLGMEQIWVREAVEGRWFQTLRTATEAFITATAHDVTGRVTYLLRPYRMDPVSVVAAKPLYVRDRAIIEALIPR
jgi:argininosuccinate synthase